LKRAKLEVIHGTFSFQMRITLDSITFSYDTVPTETTPSYSSFTLDLVSGRISTDQSSTLD